MGMEPSENDLILDRLKQAVAASGLTQGEIGRRAMMPKQAISRIMTGQSLTLKSIRAIAGAIGKRVYVVIK